MTFGAWRKAARRPLEKEFNRVQRAEDEVAGFSGTEGDFHGGAGDDDKDGFFLGRLENDFRQIQVRNGRDLGVQFAENNGEATALSKNIYAEPGAITEAVGGIAGASAQEFLREAFAAADEVERNHFRLERSERSDRGRDGHGQELAGDFDLERLADGEVDVGHVPVEVQQGVQDVVELVAAHLFC
jgi:hypothetical protein